MEAFQRLLLPRDPEHRAKATVLMRAESYVNIAHPLSNH